MAYIRTFGAASRIANGEDPLLTIAEAQKQRKHALATRMATGFVMSPLTTLVKAGIQRRVEPSITEEAYIRAIILKVLIEQGLLRQ